MSVQALVDAIAERSTPLRDDADLDPLLASIGSARVVLLGEASHGTSEFYRWRDRITRRLVAEHGFSFVAVEGDWPDCWRVDRWVKGRRDDGATARTVLHAFDRWPTWMWANEEVVALIEWMRSRNDGRAAAEQVGFYGLDVYSLWESMDAVLAFLRRTDPEAAERARRAYGCFDPYREDVQEYAMATAFVPATCEEAVVEMLAELRRRAPDPEEDDDGRFCAEQNALVARDAERYYRAMVRGGPDSWNVRDTHMMETLERLLAHHGPASKAVVWEHNTHVGDARATDMARAGMVNVGQLARQAWGADVAIVGFSTYAGSVIAGDEWGAPMRRMPVPPAREGSWEALLHRAGAFDKLLLLEGMDEIEGSTDPRGHRAVGVVYHPETERYGNYVPSVLPYRYDALLHLDRTTALRPLHFASHDEHEPPETYPSGM